MEIADFDLARTVYSALTRTYPYLGLSDTDPAYAHVMRRYGPELEAQGVIRRVGSGRGTLLAHKEKFPNALFGRISRGVDTSEPAT